jgi:hypothetical protein
LGFFLMDEVDFGSDYSVLFMSLSPAFRFKFAFSAERRIQQSFPLQSGLGIQGGVLIFFGQPGAMPRAGDVAPLQGLIKWIS